MSVIETSTKAAVEVLPFHLSVYKIAQTGQRAEQTMAQRMQALVTSRYGETAPTFDQHRADLKALDQLARDKGLTDGQWMRRPYNAAIVALFDKLPEAQTPEAIAKREQRAARDKVVKEAIAKAKAAGTIAPVGAPVGAPAGETQERAPGEGEQLEQMVTRVGVFECLYACLRILASDKTTEAQAVHMRKMADKAKDESAKADKAARLAAIKPDDAALRAIDSAAATLASCK